MLAKVIDKMQVAASGWKNFVFRNEAVEMIFERRQLVCDGCKHKKPRTCGLCGCPLAAKLRRLDASCPAGRW